MDVPRWTGADGGGPGLFGLLLNRDRWRRPPIAIALGRHLPRCDPEGGGMWVGSTTSWQNSIPEIGNWNLGAAARELAGTARRRRTRVRPRASAARSRRSSPRGLDGMLAAPRRDLLDELAATVDLRPQRALPLDLRAVANDAAARDRGMSAMAWRC